MLMHMLVCVPSLASASMNAGHCTDALKIVPAAASAVQADYASVCTCFVCVPSLAAIISGQIQRMIKHPEVVAVLCHYALHMQLGQGTLTSQSRWGPFIDHKHVENDTSLVNISYVHSMCACQCWLPCMVSVARS